MKKVFRKSLCLMLAAAVILGGSLTDNTTSLAVEQDKMEVHFIDVGQGDSTLITYGEHAMLIDAGDDSKGTAIQNYLQKRNIKKLDYLILTHPDTDHIGGAPVIITKFDIGKVFVSNYEKDNKTYQKLIQALDDKQLKYSTPRVGSQYSLGKASFMILAPNDEYDNPNDASVALLVKNGSNKFLFTGDAGEDAEEDILDTDIDISADVYKVGHHGSRYSTSKAFFRAVKPSYAVISCAEGNSYGHPHAETLNTLRTNGVKVYRTDEEGTIVATSDGKKITFNVPESETWKAGEPTQSASASKSSQSAGKASVSSETKSTDQASGQGTSKPAGDSAKTATGTNDTASAVQEAPKTTNAAQPTGITYVLNKNTHKFHLPSCYSVDTIKAKNREDTTMSRDEVIGAGYVPCKNCNP